MQVKVLKIAFFVAVSLLIPACAEDPSQIFTGTQQAIQQGSQSNSLSVAKAEFGIVRIDPQDYKVSFTPTNKVPLKNETAYGWRIRLKGYQGQVTWREIYQLPKAAKNWGLLLVLNFQYRETKHKQQRNVLSTQKMVL